MLRVVTPITTATSRHGDSHVRGDRFSCIGDSRITPPRVERDPASGIIPGEFGNFSVENRCALMTLYTPSQNKFGGYLQVNRVLLAAIPPCCVLGLSISAPAGADTAVDTSTQAGSQAET